MHALAADVLDIFKRESTGGLEFLFRWAHVLAGITWIGLLYYFNFVQVPSFAQLDAGSRNNAIDKLASRALWWFRWAAAATFALGVIILLIEKDGSGDPRLFSGDYWKSTEGTSIATGILLGVTMFLNVWLMIWPGQKKVIANARNVLAGGEADPTVPAAARKAALPSRQNTIFSFPMLFFMIGTAHFFGNGMFSTAKGGDRAIYWVITLVIWGALEANALGYIGGTGQNLTNWIYDDHRRAIGAGLVLVVIWYLLWVIIF
jgi:uncharacterized membrane protein